MRSPCCLCVCVPPLFFCFLCGPCHIKGKEATSSFQNFLSVVYIMTLPVAQIMYGPE
jgi:hypothetical protein